MGYDPQRETNGARVCALLFLQGVEAEVTLLR